MENIKKERKIDKKAVSNFLINNGIYIAIGLIILFIVISEPSFLSLRIFINILQQSSVKLLLALGVGGLIVLAGTDLAIGRIVGLVAVVSASLMQQIDYSSRFYANGVFTDALPVPIRMIVVILIVVAIAVAITGISGYIVAKFDIHPFVVTLGTQVMIYGINTLYYSYGPNIFLSLTDPTSKLPTRGQPLGRFIEEYTNLATGNLFQIGDFKLPYLVLIAIIVTAIVWVLWNKTVFGKNMFAVGGNPEAAKVSGINVTKVIVLTYVLAGVLYGVGGFLEAARIGSANNSTGNAYELDAIAACVVGGVSFSGGIGKISGIIIGVLIFQILTYGMQYVGISFEWQNVIKGLVIVAAVALDRKKYMKQR